MSGFLFGKIVRVCFILFSTFMLAACGGRGSDGNSSNSAPTASYVNITDDNGGNAVVGDSLTGHYTYADADGDAEGATTFRWLRNGVAISGATASTYTLAAADVPAQIIFEVTPVAVTGTITGSSVVSAVLATGTPPKVSGLARYLDINLNGINDAGDQLIVPFDQTVTVNGANGSDFTLPVSGDSLGSGASVSAGPAANEITITLGTSPSLKTRQDYTGATAANSPSGIDVSSSIMPDVIEGVSGIDAQASTAIDMIPAYVDTLQSLGTDSSTSVVFGDVDRDGDMDMVVANFGQPNRVYTNNGSGSFTDSGQSLGADNNSTSIALGDLDGDGDPDMVVANYQQPDRVYINNGSGGFSDSGQSLGTYGYSTSVALGDVDSDGDLDMVVAMTNGDPLTVYINNGSGGFTYSGQFLGMHYDSSVALGDIDGDGDLDIVVDNAGHYRPGLHQRRFRQLHRFRPVSGHGLC